MYAGLQWAGRSNRTKGIYKYIQWTYIQERGNRSSQKRDLVTDDSMQLATYVKTSD
jgi:hypothetical protein